MTVTDFKALFPEFGASTYDDRIQALLDAAPLLDADRLGNQLNFATGNWVADKLSVQDFTIKYGVGGALGSSTSTEKRVGEVSIKSSQSHSQSSTTGTDSGGGGAGLTMYGKRYRDLLREAGMGALVV